MPARELGRDDAIIDLRKVPGIRVREVMDREHHGDTPALGDRDHPDRDGIAAVGEQYVGPVDVEKLLEELQDRADFLQGLLAVPRGILANEGDGDLLPAGIEDPCPIGAADRRAHLTGLVQIRRSFSRR